jgi:hypothetical protein
MKPSTAPRVGEWLGDVWSQLSRAVWRMFMMRPIPRPPSTCPSARERGEAAKASATRDTPAKRHSAKR